MSPSHASLTHNVRIAQGPDYACRLQAGEHINAELRTHQESASDWELTKTMRDLHAWGDRFVVEFKLNIGPPALMVERLRSHLGHYRPGRNAFGLRDEIAIHDEHLAASPYWRVLGTLLHECLHSWQEHNGTPPASTAWNYHNREFRDKAKSLGLIVDKYGHTAYAPGDTPFFLVLSKYGISQPDVPDEVHVLLPCGRSKLHLYVCPCGVKVRVGRSRFNARWLDCGGLFEGRG